MFYWGVFSRRQFKTINGCKIHSVSGMRYLLQAFSLRLGRQHIDWELSTNLYKRKGGSSLTQAQLTWKYVEKIALQFQMEG